MYWPGSSCSATGRFCQCTMSAADGMTPAHVSPHVAFRVVLVEQVILAFVKDGPVGIIHEILGRGEVVLRPPGLIVRFLCD